MGNVVKKGRIAPDPEHMLPLLEAALATTARFMDVPPERLAPIPVTSAGLFQTAFGLLGSLRLVEILVG